MGGETVGEKEGVVTLTGVLKRVRDSCPRRWIRRRRPSTMTPVSRSMIVVRVTGIDTLTACKHTRNFCLKGWVQVVVVTNDGSPTIVLGTRYWGGWTSSLRRRVNVHGTPVEGVGVGDGPRFNPRGVHGWVHNLRRRRLLSGWTGSTSLCLVNVYRTPVRGGEW